MTAIWTIRPRHKLAKLLAYFRHPLKSSKRKLFRGRLIEAIEFNGFQRRQVAGTKSVSHSGLPPNAKYGISVDGELPVFRDKRTPRISVIIPNYNHASFLRERIRSILDQEVELSELIILDDASTDDSRNVILEMTRDISVPVKLVFNEINSGSIFRQWEKGFELAKGDLIWLCESDDTCDPRFLGTLVPYFSDPSVMMAFGRIDSIDREGIVVPQSGLSLSASKFWGAPIIASAYSWFNGPFGNKNVVANVGGCLFRRQEFSPDIFSELASYRICGDWYLYSRVARGGRIAYDPNAKAYFRVHTSNSSKASLKSEGFYNEHVRIAQALRRHYEINKSAIRLLLQNAWAICVANLGYAAGREFAQGGLIGEVMKTPRNINHILLILAACDEHVVSAACRLANTVSGRGEDVTVLLSGDAAFFDRARGFLSPSVSILPSIFAERMGLDLFLTEFGITMVWVSDHEIGGMGEACRSLRIPLHKSSFEGLDFSALGPEARSG